MNERPHRFGLQAWLLAVSVAIGLMASLAITLVFLPRLESAIRTEQSRQTGNDLILAMRDRQILSADAIAEELETLAFEIGGDVRLSYLESPTNATVGSVTQIGYLDADVMSQPGQIVRDRIVNIRYMALTVRGRLIVQAARIVEVDNVPAVLEVAAPVQGSEAQIQLIRRRVLVAVGLILLFASLMGLALARLLGARIRGLALTARTLAGGDLTARASDTAPQELSSLGESLNTMATRLEVLVAETVGDRDRARALVGSLSEGVFAVSDRGEVTVANGAAQRMLGLPVGAETLTVAELPEPVRAVLDRANDPAVRADQSVARDDEVVLPSGIEALVSVAPQAKGVGVVVTLRDVTHERRLARTRRDLIANVSHELKTPLTAIRGFMELLESDALSSERRGQFLELMSGEVARLERLVAEQLELARLDAGAINLERLPVDLTELAAEIVESRKLLAEREGIELTASSAQLPVTVDADPARVEQILLILLDNALRHTPPAGQVTVSVGAVGGAATMSVRDTGSGISRDDQQFIFDRFFQADPSREGQGLGLGLAIARGWAEAHGGSIEVASTPRLGSVFTVRLPLARGGVAGASRPVVPSGTRT